VAEEPQIKGASHPPDPVDIRAVVLGALTQPMLIAMLETGEWRAEGSDLTIKVTSSQTVIDMTLGNDARKVMVAIASGALGRPIKLKVLPGGTAQAAAAPVRSAGNGGGRTRAEQDPIVQRMKEKFGAEIRTIIDYQDKK
jgi:hypothetical protein